MKSYLRGRRVRARMRARLAAFACTLSIPGQMLAQDDTAGAVGSARPTLNAKPVPLNWRAIRWPSLEFGREAVEGGAALYTLPSPSGRKMRIDLVFETGAYALPPEKRPALGATVDLFLQGGIGTRNFEELQQYLLEHGLIVSTRLSSVGYLVLSVEGLSEDFDVALGVMRDMVLKQRFDRDALELWKQERIDEFQSLLDASNARKQARFIEREAIRLAFGPGHWFATSLERMSKKSIEAIQNEDVRDLGRKLINRTGLQAILTGSFTAENRAALKKMLVRIPRLQPVSFAWMPERLKSAPSQKIRATIIQKSDMSQASVSLRYYLPSIGRLNRFERTRWIILREIFSSSGGVVGNDRFSKAMRADSGISYSAHASFDPDAVEPNTNVGVIRMSFQAPPNRLAEGVALARKTWLEFATRGATRDEFENARVSRMNTTLATETTIFDKADEFIEDLMARTLPTPTSVESSLVRLEQETNVDALNASLLRVTQSGTVPVLVAMGNIDEATLAALRKLPDLEIEKVVKFEDLVNELK